MEQYRTPSNANGRYSTRSAASSRSLIRSPAFGGSGGRDYGSSTPQQRLADRSNINRLVNSAMRHQDNQKGRGPSWTSPAAGGRNLSRGRGGRDSGGGGGAAAAASATDNAATPGPSLAQLNDFLKYVEEAVNSVEKQKIFRRQMEDHESEADRVDQEIISGTADWERVVEELVGECAVIANAGPDQLKQQMMAGEHTFPPTLSAIQTELCQINANLAELGTASREYQGRFDQACQDLNHQVTKVLPEVKDRLREISERYARGDGKTPRVLLKETLTYLLAQLAIAREDGNAAREEAIEQTPRHLFNKSIEYIQTELSIDNAPGGDQTFDLSSADFPEYHQKAAAIFVREEIIGNKANKQHLLEIIGERLEFIEQAESINGEERKRVVKYLFENNIVNNPAFKAIATQDADVLREKGVHEHVIHECSGLYKTGQNKNSMARNGKASEHLHRLQFLLQLKEDDEEV